MLARSCACPRVCVLLLQLLLPVLRLAHARACANAGAQVLSMLLSLCGLVTVSASLNSLIDVILQERRKYQLQARLLRLDADTATLVASDGGDGAPAAGASGTGAAPPPAALQRSATMPNVALSSAGGLPRTVARAWAASERLSRWWATLVWLIEATAPLLVAILAGTCLGYYVEGWTLLDSAYFALISILTVGYGDFAPSSPLGRGLCTVLLPFVCAAALRTVSILGSALLSRRQPALESNGLDDQIARMERLGAAHTHAHADPSAHQIPAPSPRARGL